MVRTRAMSRSRAPRVSRKRISLDYHEFARYGDAFYFTSSNTSDPAAYTYQVSDVLAISEFGALFDSYKIKKVVVNIQLVNNPNSTTQPNNTPAATANSENFFPKLWYIRDYDDNTAETLLQLKERAGVKYAVMRPNKTLKIVVKPKVQLLAYKTLATSGYTPKGNQWLDMGDTTVPHYGLKICCDNLGLDPVSTAGFRFRIDVRYFMAFKGVR
jgi:hypothetical protein